MTIELAWSSPDLPPLPEGTEHAAHEASSDRVVEIELSEGRILDAVPGPSSSGAWPSRPLAGAAPRRMPEPSQSWILGESAAGCVRARIEAPLGASLLVRAGGQATRFPLVGLLETTEQTPPTSPVSVTVRRLPWDALEIHLTEGDGRALPGSRVPVSIGFNFLLAEPEQVVASFSAELRPARGKAPLWRFDSAPELMEANSLTPANRQFQVTAPRDEGTYVLEVRATWELASAAEGSRLTRIFRRRKSQGPVTVTRRMSLVVVSPTPQHTSPAGDGAEQSTVVDAIDLTRGRPARPMISGRAPLERPGRDEWRIPDAALVEPGLRDRVRDWIHRGGDTILAPADQAGLAWAAVELRVPNPGRPHRLKVAVAQPLPEEGLGVALVAPGQGRERNPRVLLDSRVMPEHLPAEAAQPDAAPRWHSWLVWPDDERALLTLVNRSDRASARVVSIELIELGSELPRAPLLTSPGPTRARVVALDVAGRAELDRFGGAAEGLPGRDVLEISRNVSQYALHCGASTLVLPAELADRHDRQRLDGQAAEDSIGPDALNLCLDMLARRGLTALLDVSCNGPLDELPPPDSQEARDRGIARLDAQGRSHRGAYQLLHPDVRDALRKRLEDAIRPRLTHPNLQGLAVRLGSGPTVLGPPDTGLDDTTYAAFIQDTFSASEAKNVPGLDPQKRDRLADRAAFVTGPGKSAWLEWRARQLASVYGQLAESVRAIAPEAMLALVTPGLDDGPAGDAARLADEQGQPPDQAWRAVGLDLSRWPTTARSPLLFRGIEPASDGLALDLAVSPELDHAVSQRPARGYWVGLDSPGRLHEAPSTLLFSRPGVTSAALGHALAVLDPKAVVLAASSVAGREEGVAGFARIFRALPSPAEDGPPSPRLSSGVAVRSTLDNGQTYLAIANDTPYEILQAMAVKGAAQSRIDDLGRGLRLEPAEAKQGGQELVLRLPPHGIAAIRIAASKVEIEPAGSYLPALPELEARAQTISRRLEHGTGLEGPPLPGFEPAPVAAGSPGRPAPPPALAEIPPLPRGSGETQKEEQPGPLPPVLGWTLWGFAPNQISLDATGPHSGRAALRLDAKTTPVAAASDEFIPPGGRALLLRTWIRCDQDEGRIRVWIEGRAKDQPILRHADLSVGRDWAERTIRVPELPQGGLDSLRVRYEWLGPTPALVWIDDLELAGQGASDSGRRVQRALLEALQAYRAKRYADFARLLESHRVRRATPDLAQGAPSDLLRTGQSTDLPAGRRLR
jgi:hypothetical protein